VIRIVLRVALSMAIAGVTACASASAPASTPTATPAPISTAPPATPSPAVSTSVPPSEIPSGTTTVEIGDNFYLPQQVNVSVGARVLWVNRGQMTHTASARDESFESGNMEFGQTYEHVFAVAGRYTYYCVQHEDMIGIVEVR
jgi:plastocyanin